MTARILLPDRLCIFYTTLSESRRIAWSKNGCVAYISPDGYTINLKVFFRDPASGKWDLGKDVPLEFPQGRDVFPLVHLSWSHLGNDLAVMDEVGRVMVFQCQMALDRLQFIRAELSHPESEADVVVGMHWLAILPYEQKVRLVPYQCSDIAHTSSEPHRLVGKS